MKSAVRLRIARQVLPSSSVKSTSTFITSKPTFVVQPKITRTPTSRLRIALSYRSRSYATAIEAPVSATFPPGDDYHAREDLQPVAGSSSLRSSLEDIRSILEDEIGGADTWVGRVESAISDLERPRRLKIGVFGDALAAPQDVVSALLQDPLVDTETARNTLLSRHNHDLLDVIHISPSLTGRRAGSTLSSQASLLRTSGCDMMEINSADAETTLSHLLTTDRTLIVLDPIRLTSTPQLTSILPTLLFKGSVHFVINGPLPPRTTQASIETTLRNQLAAVVMGDPSRPTMIPEVSFVRAEEALRALDALSSGLSDEGLSSEQTRAFDIFQQQFISSNLGPLQSVLAQAPLTSQLETARLTAELAIMYIASIISLDRKTTNSVSYTVSQLRRTATQAAVRAKHLSVVSRGIDGGVVEGSVEQEMQAVKRDLDSTFKHRLNWLSLIAKLRVDDVGSEVGTYLGQSFGRGLEQRLVFETGQLAELKDSLSISADKLLQQLSTKSGRASVPAPHPFSSRILLNHLSTLSLSIPPLESSSLLTPLTIRRQQLQGFPVSRLQQSAQRTLLSSYAAALVSVSMSWVAYVEPVAVLSSGTAVGTGLLGTVLAFALGQRMWEKTQRRFWQDWDRIISMLKGDLQAQFASALDSQVVAKPLAAADGLEQLVKKREERLDNLQRRVDAIQDRLRLTS